MNQTLRTLAVLAGALLIIWLCYLTGWQLPFGEVL